MRKISIIIPIYNEEKTLERIIKSLEKVDFIDFQKELIFVDDGSTDNTSIILKKHEDRHKIIFHEKNKGKGAAIKTGLDVFTGDYVIIQDADLEYNPDDIVRILKFAIKKKSLVVYGSRILKKNPRSSAFFYLGGISLTFLTNILYGTKITDEPTCYKLFHKSVFDKIKIYSSGFEFCPEITAKVAKLKIPINEIAISYNPRSRKMGKKIKLKDFFIAIYTLLKYKFKKND